MYPIALLEKIRGFARFALGVTLTISLYGCGFFHGSDTTPKKEGADAVMETAYSQIGKKYKAGAASPKKGFDCSGFVYWVYRTNGYEMPRTSTDQAKYGKKVARKGLQKGDVVVFKVNQSPRGLHTGIYVGKNTFIHSPSKGKSVKLDKLDAGYWKKKLVAARRVL